LLPQLGRLRRWSWAHAWLGAEQILIGAVLKIVIADRMAPLADRAFESPEMLDSLGIALGVVFFAFQIYGDFAGYSLMAIGLGRIMGLSFPVNFRRPYLAVDFSDFWRRWHISLSQWLRDYLYIPLGGNRRRGARNLMATMVLGGLWHGAGWPFLIWGALHGAYLALTRGRVWRLGRWPRRALVFGAVCLAWIFFRAADFGTAWAMISGLLSFSGASLEGLGPKIPILIALLLIMSLMVSETLLEDHRLVRHALVLRPVRLGRAVGLTLSLPILGAFNGGAFVYFQF
jgi:D-alanyl-lipoteichoic acid acyltransferase DltB (MBOAT superfamily)